MQTRPILRLALLVGVAIGLADCSALRNAAGGGKESPDEFAVVTKAPLVIPPDFNLKPPAPGAGPTNQMDAAAAAQAALFNSDPATVAATLPPTMSEGERYLLAYARVQDADPAIRQQIASDVSGMRGADDSFTDNILFGAPTGATGSVPVDADAEARRLDAARAGTAPAPGSAAPSAPPPPKSDDGDSGSWWPF